LPAAAGTAVAPRIGVLALTGGEVQSMPAVDEQLAEVRSSVLRERSVPLVHDLEHRNRALVEAIPDPMIRVACDGTYLDVRADDPSQLVRPPAELIGRN
jgi:hypothetical protein